MTDGHETTRLRHVELPEKHLITALEMTSGTRPVPQALLLARSDAEHILRSLTSCCQDFLVEDEAADCIRAMMRCFPSAQHVSGDYMVDLVELCIGSPRYAVINGMMDARHFHSLPSYGEIAEVIEKHARYLQALVATSVAHVRQHEEAEREEADHYTDEDRLFCYFGLEAIGRWAVEVGPVDMTYEGAVQKCVKIICDEAGRLTEHALEAGVTPGNARYEPLFDFREMAKDLPIHRGMSSRSIKFQEAMKRLFGA